jgi:hypothetical protein
MRRKTVVREHYIPIAIVDRMAKSRPTYFSGSILTNLQELIAPPQLRIPMREEIGEKFKLSSTEHWRVEASGTRQQ